MLLMLVVSLLYLPGGCAGHTTPVDPALTDTQEVTSQTMTHVSSTAPSSTEFTSQTATTTTLTTTPEQTETQAPTPEPSGMTTAETTATTASRPTTTRQQPSESTTTPLITPAQSEPANVTTIVGLGLGKDYAATTAQAIANAGGLTHLIKSGCTVLIKPNLCWSNITSRPVNTDYRVVAEIVRQVRSAGAGRIIIAEGPFGPECFSEAMLAYNHYDRIEDVELISLNVLTEADCYERTGQNSVTGKALFIPRIYVDADVVITVAKMKTHNAGMVTLGLKNAFGVPPRSIYGTSGALSGSKLMLHESYDFNEAIVEINLIRTPDFVVIDGIVAGEGSGPLKNTSVDAQIIIAGSDIVAVDTVAATFMGFNPAKIPHLALACKAGLGEGNLNAIGVVGGYLPDLIIDFDSIFPKD